MTLTGNCLVLEVIMVANPGRILETRGVSRRQYFSRFLFMDEASLTEKDNF